MYGFSDRIRILKNFLKYYFIRRKGTFIKKKRARFSPFFRHAAVTKIVSRLTLASTAFSQISFPTVPIYSGSDLALLVRDKTAVTEIKISGQKINALLTFSSITVLGEANGHFKTLINHGVVRGSPALVSAISVSVLIINFSLV